MQQDGGCWRGLWLGLAGALLTLVAAAFGPYGTSMKSIEGKLRAAVQTALAREGMGDIGVRMNGQTAHLTGAVSTTEAKAKAMFLAMRAAGQGGPYAGGVTRVVDELVVGEKVRPFSWNAERSGQTLRLFGHVPGEEARKAVLDAARTRFEGVNVVDEMTIAHGAPSGDWAAAASDALVQLSKLTRGKARLIDEKVVIIGEGEQAAVADVRAHFEKALTQPFVATVVDVTAEGQGLGIPEIQGVNLSEPNAETCQRAFALIMRANVIEFASSSADINVESLKLLDNLAAVARRCDQFTIRIEGHTDATGDPESNLALSRARAEAVRVYLAQKGVSQKQMQSEGYGQTRPRAPNTTNQSRARNRRIEFNVS